MTLYRARVMDTPESPFAGGRLRAEADCGLVVTDGVIVARGPFAETAAAHPGETTVDLRAGILLPGLVDTHAHFPQVRIIGALGMPLLRWLEQCALPEEARLASVDYARDVAREFIAGLVAAGTTTALVFGSHFAPAMDALFTEAASVGVRITAGLVVSDRSIRADLLTTPDAAYSAARGLAERWHGKARARYAVTPRFSLAASDALLEVCGALLRELPGACFTSHVNENLDEIAEVARLFPDAIDYVDTYDRHGLLGARSVLAHDVHPSDRELALLATRGASVAHCPTSNAALASGSFPFRRHAEHGVRVALGTDVGAGTGFSLFKEGLQAYFVQQLLGAGGLPLGSAHLLYLATRAGAEALGLGDQVGDLSVGRQFDALWLCPREDSTLGVGLRHASSDADALAKLFALGTPADIAQVWIGGAKLRG